MTLTLRAITLAGLVLFATLLALGIVAGPAAAERYVAMGDSYSAGTGSSSYDLDNDCQRSSKAYGPLIKGDLGAGSSFRFIACSGARINHILNSAQNANPAQSSVLGTDTLDVTVSIGGNDAGFGDVLLRCGMPLVSCDGDIDAAQDYIRNTMPGRLDDAYARIRLRAPNARVGVVGYPRLFPANGDDCSAATFFSAGEIARLNQTADMLADVARDRARAHGFAFIDSRPAFLGHAWCEDEWINGLSNPTNKSYHPNDRGYVGYAGIARGAMLATPDPSFTRGPNGRIAFSSSRDGNAEIYVINGNGTFPVNLTENPATDRDPVFSPDGTRIAFASDRTGDFEIYTMASTGGPATRLTNSAGDDLEPSWAPNGRQIVFRSARHGNNEIYRMNANGSGQTRLTNNAVSDFAPSFSPDGAEIVFQRYTAGGGVGQGNEIFKMNADGQGQINLTNNAGAINDGGPEWSPDGTRIAFHSNRDGNFEIYTMSATGGSVTRRTSDPAEDRHPAWAPGAGHIVFESDRAGTFQIYTMSATGGSATRRTTGTAVEQAPSWQGDAQPPQTTIESGPPASSNDPVATFSFGADELGSTFECRFDAGPFQPCTSPHSSPPLEDGPHAFAVRAKDPSGNVDPDPATRSFTIDTAGKLTTITAGPNGPTASPEATFEFVSEDESVTFECRLDPGPDPEAGWESCESPHPVGPLPDGDHRFEVRGTDRLGNVEEPPGSRDFTVDTVAPTATITLAPAAIGVDRNPVFEFTADEPGVTFECGLAVGEEDAGWEPCESPRRLGPLDDGRYGFSVRATDPAGNAGPASAEAPFRIDTKPPVTTIAAGPSAAEPSPEVSFEFGADEPDVRYECRLDSTDDTAWAPCASPRAYTGLHHGRHSFQVRAIDLAGNVEAPPVVSEFGVKTDPGIVVTSGPDPVSDDPEPELTFTADDPDTQFECRFDSTSEADWEPCNSPYRPAGEPGSEGGVDPLTDGAHTFELRGTDWFELEKAEPDRRPVAAAPYEWTVITGAPRARIIAGPTGLDRSRTAVFELDSGWGADSLQCRLDGMEWAACDPGSEPGDRLQTATFPGLFDGSHELRVRASGPLFGMGPELIHEWEVDATPPEVRIDRGPSRHVASPTATWEFSGAGDPSGFRCRVDGSPPAGAQAEADGFGACGSPLMLTGLGDGDHRFEVIALDAAGNTSPIVSRAWTVDTRGPDVVITAAPAVRTDERSARIAFEADESPASFTCRTDSGSWVGCASPVELRGLEAGGHRFEVRATDPLGNAGATATHEWRIDSPARPRITIRRQVRLNRAGRAAVATVVCPKGSACTVSAPRKVRLRAGGRRVTVRLQSPRRVAAGRKATVRLAVPKRSRAALRRRAARLRLTVQARPAKGPAAKASRTVTVRG